MPIIIRDMEEKDEYYVGTCTHVNENNIERENSCQRRISWLKSMENYGLRVKVAILDGQHAGFLYLIPIEINPLQIQGKDLMIIPCLVSHSRFSGNNIGKKLIKAAVEETKNQNRKGIATIAFFWDFWFMPAKYFLKLGFKVAEKRDNEAILWKPLTKNAETPKFRKENYSFNPVKGKIVVDLFWNRFCLTSDIEAQRVREVASEYENDVILNEYSAVDQKSLQKYGIERRIYVNGKIIEVGPEIEKTELRTVIEQELNNIN